MLDLTTASYWARKVIKFIILLIIAVIIGRILWLVGTKIYQAFFPQAPPEATIGFGKLPAIIFPLQESTQKFTYKLETPTGELPKTPTILPVYVMPIPHSSLLALDQARVTIRKLGFDGTEERITDTIYRFKKRDFPTTLEMNIITGAFSVTYDLNADPRLTQTRPQTPNEAITSARSILGIGGLLTEDLAESPTTTEFIAYQGGKFVEVSSLSEANFIRVDMFRQDYEKLPIVTPDRKANVWFLLLGDKIIAGEYHYFPIDKSTSSTYPIKKAQDAWEELKNEGGLVASVGKDQKGIDVVIRRIYLAYYDSDELQSFFQPVYVFEGDNDFSAYVPAITKDFYEP
ncbi:hypothetical protein HY405_00890 [Candidatus Microgenomates bacterium]|nr:hypothetical protein [Candidatus Microgenomates bacterium]